MSDSVEQRFTRSGHAKFKVGDRVALTQKFCEDIGLMGNIGADMRGVVVEFRENIEGSTVSVQWGGCKDPHKVCCRHLTLAETVDRMYGRRVLPWLDR
jgi:hypothetical protein